MVKFKEATERLYKDVFICKRCKAKIRSVPQKIIRREVKCRKCGCKIFRLAKKTKAVAKK